MTNKSQSDKILPIPAKPDGSCSADESCRVKMMSRRSFIASAASVAGLVALGNAPIQAAVSEKYEKALEEALNGATPSNEMVTLKMPEIAENGNVVAITIDASAAEAAGKKVTSLQVFATDNPWPYVATFHLSKLSGKALVTSRMRLARSQKVVALAALDGGEYLMTETFVKVTIGGCGG